MSEGNKSLRIDWFDGTLIEETRLNVAGSSEFDDEEQPEPQRPKQMEKKPIGFKKLLELSMLNPPGLTLEVSHKTSFWLLLDTELKDDFIVLIVRILSKLFKSVQPGDQSVVTKLLKNKFFKSNFNKTLKLYVCRLPNVKIVEKRMNSHLWDDVETFYFEILQLCEGIINVDNKIKEQIIDIQELVEITEISAVGVKREHSERFSDDLFKQIKELKCKIITLIDEFQDTKNPEAANQKGNSSKDVYSFKYLSLFPTRNDLLRIDQVKIKPNIINGSYPNVENYIDLQFKLLREDCFAPLREGIIKYMENPSKRRHENIRLFPKVRIIRTYISNNKVGHLVDIAWKERTENKMFDFKKYTNNKQLMFGSLLLFTSDNFENVLCATVLDSNLYLLNEGYITVTFRNLVSKKIFTEPYLMVESEVFFEPYHRVLKVLQNAGNDLPMRRYIVDVQVDTQPPKYLSSDTIYHLQVDKTDISFPVLDLSKWPTTAFDFDESQMEAYKFALTREFAVIQGPPGTGKTYIGVKIASTVLQNLSLEGTPMLIICYTNHALDQFLEGILKVTTNLVRLGSQSKNKNLQSYTLNNIRGKIKSKYSYLYTTRRTELENIVTKMTELQSEIEKCEKEIISYNTIKPYLKIGDKPYELTCLTEDPILNWLFRHLQTSVDDVDIDDEPDDDRDDWEKQFEDATDKKLVTCFSEDWALKEIDSMTKSKQYIGDVTDDEFVRTNMMEKFDAQISRIRTRLQAFKKYIKSYQHTAETKFTEQISNLYEMAADQRWTLYFSAVRTIENELLCKMDTLLKEHNACSEELEEISTLIDAEVMKTTRVVGVTTTTAARRHDLLRKLLSPIVIVEEAAEVLEAHIVASLTDHCQHLILIGDHKQLRPTASHYKLAKYYNLEISLFERMIRNGIHARALTTQRRMRDSFVSLLVPVVYERLDCHPVVNDYKDVKGMTRNLYFYDHDTFEDSEGLEDSWSHKNTFEAKWCVALATYLRQMKYSADDITILATYTGQATTIKQLSKNNSLLHGVKITVVDNYQGEENRIVILSLVRSNRDGKIGFLTAQNRICVALSRAKEGFYMFGNMDVLKSANSIWKFINNKLEMHHAIGRKLILRCETHKNNTLDIINVEDFEKCTSGSCLRVCAERIK